MRYGRVGKAVSYTHLTDGNGNSYDISNYDYLGGRNIIYEIQNDISRKAVSYTHLDVYKRQDIHVQISLHRINLLYMD